MKHDSATLDAAIKWHVRLSSGTAGDADWEAFAVWVEADPAHNDAYDQVALSDELLTDALAATPVLPLAAAQNDNEPVAWTHRRGLMAVAVGIIALLAVSSIFVAHRDFMPIETRAGEVRNIALDDGSRIALNGGTRIEIDRSNPRFVKLASGEAVFTVKHDASDPFTVEVGDHNIVDAGTEFNVRHDSDGVEVAVSQGSVQLNPRSDAVLVNAGYQVSMARDATKPVLSQTDPTSVGGWRTGQLAYRDATMARIATDLSRLLGPKITVGADGHNRRFSGLIRLEGDRAQAIQKIGPLLGVKIRRTRDGWALGE